MKFQLDLTSWNFNPGWKSPYNGPLNFSFLLTEWNDLEEIYIFIIKWNDLKWKRKKNDSQTNKFHKMYLLAGTIPKGLKEENNLFDERNF